MQPWNNIIVEQNTFLKFNKVILMFLSLFQLNFSVLVTPVGSVKPRKICVVEKFDYCSSVKNLNSIKNPFVRNIFQGQRDGSPNSLKKCPIMGIITQLNSPGSKSFINNVMPLGKYLIKTAMYNEAQPEAKQLTFDTRVTFTLVADWPARPLSAC